MLKRGFKKFNQSTWRNPAFLIPLLVANWWLYGRVFSEDFFDKHFDYFSLLNSRGDALTYVGVLFAVQLPIFILLLEKMISSGYVRRIVLPSVIQFREILVSYIILSFLLLVSPRSAYYYLPILGLTVLSIYTVYEAVRVMFERRKLKTREDEYISRLVEQVFSGSLKGRVAINNFFDDLKKQSYVTHSLLELGDKDGDTKRYEIRANRAGVVSTIDLKGLNELVQEKYYSGVQMTASNSGKVKEDKRSQTNESKITLVVRPQAKVKEQDTLMQLTIPKEAEVPKKNLLSNLRGCVKIDYDHPDSADRQLDDMVRDFRQQLRESIDKDDVVSLDDSLGFYKLLTKGLAVLGSKDDAGYTFKAARNEFHQFIADSVSEKLEPIADIINEEFSHAIRDKKQDVVKRITRSIYSDILGATNNYDTLTAARADQALTYALNNLIFAEVADIPDKEYREKVFESLSFRLKEHTGLLLYHYRQHDESASYTEDQLLQWLSSRLDDARGFLLATYKKSNYKMFKHAKQVFDAFEEDYSLYESEVEDLIMLARCNLFVVAAYMHERGNETEEQKKAKQSLDNIFKRLTAQDLTKILVRCVDKDYSDAWRVDTYDLVADGKMRSVPDFGMKLKSLWASYMLKLNNIPQNLDAYDGIPLGETWAFSDAMSKREDAYLVKHLEELPEQRNLPELKQLVDNFIEARRQWENDKLIKEPLDQKKIDKFREDIVKGYKERALAFSVFKPSHRLKFVEKASNKGFKTFGWNQIREKAGFIGEWHVGYYHNGEEHGTQIANAENELILKELFKNPTRIPKVEDWVSKLQTKDNSKWLIINIGAGSWLLRQRIAKYLRNNKDYHTVYFKGVKQVKPAEFLYSDSLEKGLYAVRTNQMGVLNVKGDAKLPVDVSIDAYSHDADFLKNTLDNPPAWLTKKGNKDEQENFLKTMVRMFIDHPFKYEPPKDTEVLFYPLDDEDVY